MAEKSRNTKKWIAYTVTGVVGLGVLAGGAAAAASTMELRTGDGNIVPGGTITGNERGVLDRDSVDLLVTDSSVTVISAPSADSVDSTPSVDSPASPWSAPSVDSPDSVDSPASPWSAPSVDSPASPVSVDSPASAWSD